MASKVKEKEVKEETIDLESIRTELKDYVDIKIKNGIENEITNVNKKIVSEKNRRLFFKNIIIFILLVIIGYLVFLLYKEDFFASNKVINNNENKTNEIKDSEEQTEEKKEEVSLEELISQYSYLLNNININETSEYITNYYTGDLNKELKSYLAFNNVDFNQLSLEEDYNIFESNLIKDSYESLFNDEFEMVSFKYNNNKIRYISKLDSYVSETIVNKIASNISREIVNIEVNENEVKITTIEGLIKDNTLYNILTLNEVSKDNLKLSDFKQELNTITYTFNNKKLVSIK